MTGTKTAIKESVRIETLQKYATKSVAEIQAEIDRVIEQAMLGKASEVEEHRAAVLAKVILDRIGKAAYRG